ncbi:hypothetical protein IJG90_03680 [Candidatus Saccharibacteria bacterium]|nr:hypothetical protein [Candidatus Saccharibacteria bacterium]
MVDFNIPDNWEIRYSKYVGDLTLFDRTIYSKNKNELATKRIGERTFITFDVKKSTPLMIEISEAKEIIADIDILEKSSIIKIVKEYLTCQMIVNR